MFMLVLEKAEKPEIKWPTCAGSSKKQESSRKTSISALLTMPKTLTVWITINCGKFWKRWEYQTTRPASWEIYMQVRKQQWELDMEQQFSSVAQSCPILWDPINCSPPGSSIHGIFQARILEWVASSSSKGSSWSRDWVCASNVSSTADRFFSTEPLGKVPSRALFLLPSKT